MDVAEINDDFRVVAAVRSHHSLADTCEDLWFARQHAGDNRDQPSHSRHAAEVERGAAIVRFGIASRGPEEVDDAEKNTPQRQTKGQLGKRELGFPCPDGRGDVSEEQVLFVRVRILGEDFLLGRKQQGCPCARQRNGRYSHGRPWTVLVVHNGFYCHNFLFDLFHERRERLDDRIENSMGNPSWVRKNEIPS